MASALNGMSNAGDTTTVGIHHGKAKVTPNE